MTESLHRHVDSAPGYKIAISPGEAGLRYLELGLLFLRPGIPSFTLEFPTREAAIVILEGAGELHGFLPDQRVVWTLGPRRNVFDDLPWAVYAPPGTRLEVRSRDRLVAAVITAPADNRGELRAIFPDQVVVRSVGKENWRREVRTIIDHVTAQRLLVGETVNPPGNWSSYPPHKHDRDVPPELPMEEVYYYLVRPPQGFGLQRVYTPPGDPEPLDECYVVRCGDLVALPRGFHPVVAAGGYEMYYLWAMSGSRVLYGQWSDDPEHAWIRRLEVEDNPN
jgi:5-deoxy-glucuronate isomerase